MNEGRKWSGSEVAALRRVLANLFPRETDQRRFVSDLELPAGTISFDGSAENTWFSILERARHTVGLDALLRHALTSEEGSKSPDLRRIAEGASPGLPQASAGGALTPAQAPAPRKPLTLRFLHLTDWHVGMGEQGWLWPNVREAFFDDLGRLHQRLGDLDAVFFTGDLTQRGSAAEFEKLDAWLAAIWKRLAELGFDPVLMAVPGNHDLQRPPPKSSVIKALGAWQTDHEIRDSFWSEVDGEYRQCVRTAFAPYAAWAERQPAMKRVIPRWGALPGDVSAMLEREGLRVGVVGLNSAFLQLTGADFDKKLDLDIRQLHAACGGDAPAWLAQNDLNLLLTHHPPSWLEPRRLKEHFETEVAPPGRFALHLHGHLHEPNAYAEVAGGSRPRYRLAGPSLFGLERFEGLGGVNEERIHGYAAGRIDLVAGEGLASGKAVARVRLWPRRLVTKKSGNRVMERDSEFELDDDESLAFEVPCKGRPGAPAPASPSGGGGG